MQDSFATVRVAGLAYVGLPLAIQFACSRAAVIGLDIDQNNHSSVNYRELVEWTDCIIDTRNAMASISCLRAKV